MRIISPLDPYMSEENWEIASASLRSLEREQVSIFRAENQPTCFAHETAKQS